MKGQYFAWSIISFLLSSTIPDCCLMSSFFRQVLHPTQHL
jgi:hypothetical protein